MGFKLFGWAQGQQAPICSLCEKYVSSSCDSVNRRSAQASTMKTQDTSVQDATHGMHVQSSICLLHAVSF